MIDSPHEVVRLEEQERLASWILLKCGEGSMVLRIAKDLSLTMKDRFQKMLGFGRIEGPLKLPRLWSDNPVLRLVRLAGGSAQGNNDAVQYYWIATTIQPSFGPTERPFTSGADRSDPMRLLAEPCDAAA